MNTKSKMNQLIGLIGLGIFGIGYWYRNEVQDFCLDKIVEGQIAYDKIKKQLISEPKPVKFILWRVWAVDNNRAQIVSEYDLNSTRHLNQITLPYLGFPIKKVGQYLLEYYWNEDGEESGPFMIPVMTVQLIVGLPTSAEWIIDTPEKFTQFVGDLDVEIIETLKLYSGPYQNFYLDTPFEVKLRDLFNSMGQPLLKDSIQLIDPILETTLELCENQNLLK